MGAATRSEQAGGALLYQWTLTQADPTGGAVTVPGGTDKSVHFHGTFSGGPTAVLEGSNDPDAASFAALHDTLGGSISASSEELGFVAENTLWVRPRMTGGDGSTAIVVSLLTRKS